MVTLMPANLGVKERVPLKGTHNNCGHKAENCKAPLHPSDQIIMMADVPKAPLIACLKEKRTFLAKEPAPPQKYSHVEVMFIALKDSVEQYVATYTDKELQKEVNKYLAM